MWHRGLLVAAALIIAWGCKEKPRAETTLKDSGAPAAADDPCNLQKMAEETKKGVAKQIECVGAVVDAIGPGWVKLLKSGAELGVSISDAQSEVIEFEEEEDAGAGAFKVSMTVWEAVNKALSYAADGKAIQPRWLQRCAQNITATSTSLQAATSAVASLVQTKSIGAKALSDLVGSAGTATKAMFQVGQVLTTCTAGNNKNGVAQLNRFVKKLGAGLDAVTKSLGAISALGTCGMNIADGLVTLSANTQCAIADLKALHEQTASVRAQAQAFNQTSKQAERQYGAACERPIRDDAITEAIGLGVGRPLTDCSRCCSGEKFKTPGFEQCGDKWKVCMQACGEQFGQNDPRFFYSNSAVVDYNGAKCEDQPQPVANVEKVRCCKVCRMPERWNFGWTDCRDVWYCSAEVTAWELGKQTFDGNSTARDQCETKYELDDHRMTVDVHACKWVPKGQCSEVSHPDWGM